MIIFKKLLIFYFLLLFFILFAGCKALEKTQEDTEPEPEVIEITERDRQVSTVLLIEASKEKMLGNYLKAVNIYNKALERDPQNDAAAYELGKIHAREDMYEDAIEYAEIAIELDPENTYYLMLLADVYFLKGELEKTAEIHQQIADMDPENLSMQFDLLNTYLYLENYEKVIEIFDHIESLTGFSDQVSMKKIQLFLEMNRYDEAINEAKKLISIYPDEFLYKDYLAEIYQEKGEKEKAADVYRQAIKDDPGNALARIQLAEYYRQNDQMEKSFEHLKEAFRSPQLGVENKGRIMYTFYQISEDNAEYLKQAFELMDILIEMYPDETEINNIYGDFLYREEEYERALEKFYKSAQIDPDQYPVWEQLLHISSLLQDYESLLKFSEEALDYFFERPVLYFYNGLAHFQLENYNSAIETFELGLNFIIDNNVLKGHFYTLMGDSYNKIENYEKSDQSYENAISTDPENATALNNYSYYLSLRDERLEYAEQMSKKANELEENNPAYLDTYGWIMYKSGDYEEAEKWIQKAIDNSGDDNATILEHYGDVLYKLGYSDKAVEYWEKAKKFGDGSEFLDKKLKDGTLYE